MMRKTIILVILMTISIIFLNSTRLMGANVSDYYKEVLKFDDEGNLLMTTHDKKATSKVTYRTLGWIIKRYDAPLDAPGQKYAVIKMQYADIQYREDPNDSAYIYCYYYGDKQGIYESVYGANRKWSEILYKYGDYVYIDEIMTVCSNGVPLGTLTSNSSNCINSTGEVYYDYEGIAGARNWASKESLLTHFNKKVKYPTMVIAPEFNISEAKTNSIEYRNNAVAIGTIGSNEENEEIYNVTDGIPVTENLYVKTVADSAAYEMRFDRYVGQAAFPVKVVTTYHFQWTDYYGVKRKEDVKATRWYLVKRDFAYWRVGKLIYKYLSGIKLNNYALEGDKYQVSGLDAPEIILEQSQGYNNHISISSYEKTIKVDGGTIKGKNGLRPNIPEEDYSDVAEKCVGEYKVWNDYLKIGSTVVLRKAKVEKTTSNPMAYSIQDTTIYKSGLTIPSYKLNGAEYASTGKAYYTGYKNGTVYSVDIQAIESVTIHTPVVCNSSMYTTNTFNQRVKPDFSANNVVIGKAFSISYGTTGNHKGIKGYGYRNYSKYVAVSQIRFPIDIYYDGKIYTAGSWIDIKGDLSFVVPVGVKEGNYTYEIRNIAINASERGNYSGNINIKYNNNLECYGACDVGEFNVIGRVYGFHTKTEDENIWHTVGNKDENGNANNSLNVMPMEIDDTLVEFELITVGDYADNNDSVKILLSYYFLKDGKKLPVNVYRKINNRCILLDNEITLDYSKRQCVGDNELIKVSDNSRAKKGAQLWNGNMDMSGKLIVVPKGDYGTDIEYKDIKSKVIYGGNIIVNADIYAVNAGVEELSYLNVENWKKGCCNMWNKEGFNYTDTYTDGDFLITGILKLKKEDYVVIGTH